MGQLLFKSRSHSEAKKPRQESQDIAAKTTAPESYSKLHNLLEALSPEIRANDSELAVELRDDVKRILDKIVLLLKNISFFEGCYFRLAGSLGENSKIGLPVEQDYMLVIPMLEDENLFRVEAPKGQRYKYIRASDNVSLALSMILRDPGFAATKILSGASLVPLITLAMSRVIAEFDLWKVHKYCVKKSVITFHLQYTSKPGIEHLVNLDVCLGFKSSYKIPEAVTKIINRRKQCADHHLKSLLEDSSTLSYYVFFSPKLPNLGISASALENYYLKSLGRDNNRMKCYCLAKYLVGLFLPVIRTKEDKCTYCDESLVPSYYLKLSLLFMIEENDSNTHWSSENLPDRLIELFTRLLNRVETDEVLESVLIPSDPYLDKKAEQRFKEMDKRVRMLAMEHGGKCTPIPTAHVTLKTTLRTEDFDVALPAVFANKSAYSSIINSAIMDDFHDSLKNSLAKETIHIQPILEKFCGILRLLHNDKDV